VGVELGIGGVGENVTDGIGVVEAVGVKVGFPE
jgi:hypothetical protein